MRQTISPGGFFGRFLLLSLIVIVLVGAPGCELKVGANSDPTFEDAFSDLGQATDNTWDDFQNWWDDRF